MTAYKQFATTAYRRADSRILDVSVTTEPEIVPLNISDYRLLWERMLVPGLSLSHTANSAEETLVYHSADTLDQDMVNSLTFNLAWLIRLYDDEFPDDINTPLGHLQNFLAIPLQFMATCLQFANHSLTDEGFKGIYPFPEETHATAVGGESMQKMAGQPWTVWLFISSVSTSMLLIGALYGWIIWQKCALPEVLGISYIDWLLMIYPVRGGSHERQGWNHTEQFIGEVGTFSLWHVAGKLKKYFTRLVPQGGGHDYNLILSAREDSRRSELAELV
ncbi:hypothetical protein MFIFM68171_02536 [Madurella fahalii]|uniref:Uncharacterized protein n=1 Tax=Madurella fahalii TaxID=1157608 RepID=A0ABQ0G3L8_9PEZI